MPPADTRVQPSADDTRMPGTELSKFTCPLTAPLCTTPRFHVPLQLPTPRSEPGREARRGSAQELQSAGEAQDPPPPPGLEIHCKIISFYCSSRFSRLGVLPESSPVPTSRPTPAPTTASASRASAVRALLAQVWAHASSRNCHPEAQRLWFKTGALGRDRVICWSWCSDSPVLLAQVTALLPCPSP